MATKAQIKDLLHLKTKAGRQESGQIMVEGEKMVSEVLKSDWKVLQIYTTNEHLQLPVDQRLISSIASKDMERLTQFNASSSVLAVVEIKENTDLKLSSHSKIVIIDQLNDPGNLGSIIRTADWFGFEAVYIGAQSVEVYNPKVVQASMGAILNVPIITQSNETTLNQIQAVKLPIIITSLNGDDMRTLPQKLEGAALVIGHEARGVSPFWVENATFKCKIPGWGKAESLNAGAAAAISMAQLRLYHFIS